MNRNICKAITTESTELERLVAERHWELVVAHLNTTQGHEDSRKENPNTHVTIYNDSLFYNRAPFQVIEALVQVYPEGILKPDRSGHDIIYPMDLAIKHIEDEKTRNEVVKLFVKTHYKCFEYCTNESFQEALLKCDTEVLKYILQSNPKFIYQKIPIFWYSDIWRNPIHVACSMGMCNKIDLLLSFDPSQAQLVEEDSKMLPLHLACRPYKRGSSFDMETFKHLIEAYPQAAKEKDAKRRLPLHYACGGACYRPDNQDFVGELLKIYSEAAQIIDKRKNLPLHYLILPTRRFQCEFVGCPDNPSYGEDFDAVDRVYPKPNEMSLIIEAYPDGLLESYGLKSYGVRDCLVLERLADLRYRWRQVWHTAGRLCSKAFICASPQSMQPLRELTYDLEDLVKNVMGLPLDRPRNEGEMQDGELAGITLYYTFEALLEANYGYDTKSNLRSSLNVVMPSEPVENKSATAMTTLLHKLAYCSKFCHQHHVEAAVELYGSMQRHHFLLADQNGNLPLHLVCCAPSLPTLTELNDKTYRKTSTEGLVKSFLTPYKEAASKTNNLGKTPLDFLMENRSELLKLIVESWHDVELLVNANPIEAYKTFTKEKMYPFMLSAIGEQANLSCTFSTLVIFVSFHNLNDLGS